MNKEIKENKKEKMNTIGEIIKGKDIETYKKLEQMAKQNN